MVVPPSTGPTPLSSMAAGMATLRVSTPNGSFRATNTMGIPIKAPPSMPSNNPGIPLSARKSAGLDLNSVERRGQPNAPKERDPKSSRPHGLQEAPTFRPTEEEFKNPIEYIRKVAPEGRKYGIMKIIPPDGWDPPFAIDTERFHFRTRKQELNLADGGTRANLNYLDQLAKFHKQRTGTNLNRFPSVDKRPLDLYKLKKFVEEKGGFDLVCKGKRWAEIGRDLGYSGKIMSSLSTSLKNSYQKWLQPYEEWLKQNKPSVLQQQERENGGPYTPSPVPTPAKATLSPKDTASALPAVKASLALHATLQDGPAPSKAAEHQAPPRSVSGFTAVNSGSFTAVNSSSTGFSAINVPNGHGGTGHSTPRQESPAKLAKHTPDGRPLAVVAAVGDAIKAQSFNSLKRQYSSDVDGANGEVGENADSEDASGRRSKRLKQDGSAPTVTGSHMIQPRLPAQKFQIPRDRSNDQPGDCEVCGRGEDETTIVCDTCDAAYHRYCVDQSARFSPESDWHCSKCLVGTGEFGFEEGGIYSLKQFQEKAQHFKDKHFATRMPFDPVTNTKRPVSEEDIEREFWRLTESLVETVEVEYGADIHSTTHGSGFPTMELRPFDHYSTDPWNLNVLPLDKESLFRHIKTDISGMTVPWLYVGMCFSTFCWHSEDHYTYSANYHHFGATKTWYGIPSSDSERFEAAMRDAVPELFEQQPDLLFQLVTLLQPEKLKKAGVQVYALDQRAGQFVITFPQAYHAGFNHGFNFNEAVNFAPPDWEPFGATAIQRLQDFRRQPVFSHDELLFSAATRDHTIKSSKWLAPALERVMEKELRAREDFKADFKHAYSGIANGDTMAVDHDEPPFVTDPADLGDDETVCAFCKTYGYLSRYLCKTTGKVLCLLHAGKYDCCAMPAEQRLAMVGGHHELRRRISNSDIQSIVQKVVDISKTPEVWAEKLDTLLQDEPKPSLKSLRAVLAEGEKIDSSFPLPQLLELKAFVTRCNHWVEEATTFIARKQNRRKSEFRRGAGQDELRKKADREDSKKDSLRNPDNINKLLKVADNLSFDCPELEKLQERSDRIVDFKKRAKAALARPHIAGSELDELIDEGKEIDMDVPEMKSLDTRARTVRWFEEAKEHSDRMAQGEPLSLDEVTDFIERGKGLDVPETDDYMIYFLGQKDQGQFWESKAFQVMSVENVNFQQLDALFKQASKLPVSRNTLAAIDDMLKKQREAQERIIGLYERTKDLNFRNRPKYKEVRDTMEGLTDLNSKPPGTLDLEKEQKRHEDWMRRGKKLFGKANAPLHILLQHMQYVEERNSACLDLKDQPRMPVEPASREQSPSENVNMDGSGSSRDVFCICRKPESGMMIECELCHEWYHGRCLKIARGKVKEDDKYTCPICDYRVKIPRDAARPKLEDLQQWQDEIIGLPFQPEEEQCLARIVDVAQDFRHAISNLVSPIMSTPDDLPVQRFYLRKIEGADVLLTEETNFLRQELHKWAPVAPEPPKLIEASLSTRKPRPTKQQKMMASLGITNPEELPEHLRPKPSKIKNKHSLNHRSGSLSGSINQQSQSEQGDPIQSHTPPGLPHGVSVSENRHLSESLAALPPFTYEAMRGANSTASAFRPSSPMFSGANNPFTAAEPITPDRDNRVLSPGITAGIDPQLENMFVNPMASPQHAHLQQHKPSPDVNANPSQDEGAMDLFGSLTNGENGESDFTFAEPASDYQGDAGLTEAGEYDMPTRQLSATPS